MGREGATWQASHCTPPPLASVVFNRYKVEGTMQQPTHILCVHVQFEVLLHSTPTTKGQIGRLQPTQPSKEFFKRLAGRVPPAAAVARRFAPASVSRGLDLMDRCGNDPSAGSPTETLLRLHLPLNDKVWTSSHGQAPMKEPNHNPESSPDHSIGRCDGRCVQRAGT